MGKMKQKYIELQNKQRGEKSEKEPFNVWLRRFDKRSEKCNIFFKEVFDFMDMKIEYKEMKKS